MIQRCPVKQLLVLVALLTSSHAEATDFYVFYLGGQSNMDGFGYVDQLPEELRQSIGTVPIFHGDPCPDEQLGGGQGKWTTLKPGHGIGFRSDGQEVQYSDRFGIEVTFATRIQELFPDRRIALIKYSRGGTSIAQEAAGRFGCWEPDFDNGDGPGKGINQYDHFLATLRGAWSDGDIDDDGEADTLIPAGIVWMQGESDATVNVEIAERYQANLKRLMDLIRAAMRSDDLPVVIGLISDSGRDETDGKVWDFGDRVRRAQHDFAAADDRAAIVTSTDDYAYSDKWHYDSAGYIDLGRQFAEQLSAIIAADD